MNATVTYKCPNCDAGLIFNAEEQGFSCEFCLSHFTKEEIEDTASAERAEKIERENAEFAGEMREYHCPSCGAEVIAEKNTVADLCYYCHNPIVLSDKVTGALRPTRVIPFKFTKEEAVDEFLRFSKKKKFIPKNFFSREQLTYLSGVYYPFWVTDADTSSFMRAIGKRVRTWVSGDYRYTETSRYAVERGGGIHFEDISTSAISTEDKDMLEGVLPYPAEEYTEFSMPYLQGFVAKKRDIEREQLYGEVKGRMNSYATELLRSTARGYDSLSVSSLDLNVLGSHWEYNLLPVWIMTYIKKHKKDRTKDKTFMYAMNGATGKIFGRLPISIPKMIALATGIFLGVFALAFLFGVFGMDSLSVGIVSGLAFGGVAAAVPTVLISRSYKKGLHAPIYPLDKYANLDLTHRSDVFIGKTVTRVRISNSKKR
ncbi:MAG: TFIIB-type zinc ribbon-containing protein [Clostridia bacterium]|nr:TFIIB-type zinc ribbon-containing protein [Clostridia bacterium]